MLVLVLKSNNMKMVVYHRSKAQHLTTS